MWYIVYVKKTNKLGLAWWYILSLDFFIHWSLVTSKLWIFFHLGSFFKGKFICSDNWLGKSYMTNYLNSTSFILKYPPILHWLPDQLLPIIQQNFPGICLGFRSRTVHYFQPLWREEKLLSGTIYFPHLLKKNKQKLTF